MQRRHVIGVAGTALLGGCSGFSPALLCERGSVVFANPFEPSKQAYSAAEAPDVVATGVESGTATYRGFDRTPFEDGAYVSFDGAFYEVAVTDEARSAFDARIGEIRWEDGQTPPEGESAVRYEALPAVDRRALSRWFDQNRTRPADGGRIHGAVPYPNGTAGSRLVGAGTVWVEWNGRVYDVAVSADPARVYRHTETYRFDRVAASLDAFETHLADRHLVPLTELSPAGDEVVTEAVAGQYRGCGDDDGIESLRSHLSSPSRLPRFGTYLVSYEGTRYELAVSEWVR